MDKWHILIFVTCIALVSIVLYLFSAHQFSHIHNYLLSPYMPILKPFYWASGPLVFTLLLFLLVPIRYFRSWLKYIASWYFPLAILIISQPEWYRVTIVDPTPSGAALIAGYLLAFLTVLYIAVRRVVSYIRCS